MRGLKVEDGYGGLGRENGVDLFAGVYEKVEIIEVMFRSVKTAISSYTGGSFCYFLYGGLFVFHILTYFTSIILILLW